MLLRHCSQITAARFDAIPRGPLDGVDRGDELLVRVAECHRCAAEHRPQLVLALDPGRVGREALLDSDRAARDQALAVMLVTPMSAAVTSTRSEKQPGACAANQRGHGSNFARMAPPEPRARRACPVASCARGTLRLCAFVGVDVKSHRQASG
jgi:hypothetical protein